MSVVILPLLFWTCITQAWLSTKDFKSELPVVLVKQRKRDRIIALEIERANMTQFAEDDDEDGSV